MLASIQTRLWFKSVGPSNTPSSWYWWALNAESLLHRSSDLIRRQLAIYPSLWSTNYIGNQPFHCFPFPHKRT
ncbi:unnamed protein product [Calypogeia fissa]